jgi:sugar lactone lactonase YvrE
VINTFATSSLVKPTGIAYNNRDGSIWSADTNNQPALNNGISDFTGTTVSHATSTGADAVGSPYGGMNGPFGVEIDGLGNVWVANSAANTTSNGVGSVAKFTPPVSAGNAYTVQNFTTGALSYPVEIGFDSSNNAWVALQSSVTEFSNAGVQLGNFVSVPTNVPSGVMVDGLGRVFVANGTNSSYTAPGSLTVFSSNGTLLSTANGSVGYLAGNTIPGEPFVPTGLAIDLSGNVWISGVNNLASMPYQFVTELIGIAAPVITPVTVQSSTNKYGQRP